MSAGKELSPRYISKEGTRRLRYGAVVAGVIGWVAEISALAIGGFGVAGATVVYDVYRHKKAKAHKSSHH